MMKIKFLNEDFPKINTKNCKIKNKYKNKCNSCIENINLLLYNEFIQINERNNSTGCIYNCPKIFIVYLLSVCSEKEI